MRILVDPRCASFDVWRKMASSVRGDPTVFLARFGQVCGHLVHLTSGLPILSHSPLNSTSLPERLVQVSAKTAWPNRDIAKHCEALRQAIALSFAGRESDPPAGTRTSYIRDSAGSASADDPWRQG